MPLFNVDFQSIATYQHPSYLRDSQDWLEWRYCYEGGRYFRDRYLQQMPDREKADEFQRRKDLTPIPTYAKREINRVRNSLFQRFDDIIRRGGTRALNEAIAGSGRGVDNAGSSMNTYIGKIILPDLLVMGCVGVLIDAPRFTGLTLADVPEGFRPFLSAYSVENIPLLIPQDTGGRGDFKAVLLREDHRRVSIYSGKYTDDVSFRYYWVDEETGLVNVQRIDSGGKTTDELIITELTEIPFVKYDIGDSLIKDVCRHQIAMLNLISTDTNYAIDANYPFLTRQRAAINAAHLSGDDDSANVGTRKGLFCEKGMDRPDFIGPPTDPMRLSIDLRRELKAEVRELVMGAVADMGEDGTIDAGLAFIGECLEHGESRIWDHWTAYEQTNPARRRIPVVKYPDNWYLKTEKERIEEANALLDLMFKLPGRGVKKEIAKLAQSKLLRGRVSTEKLDKLAQEIDEAPYCTSDPKIVIPAKKEGVMSGETAALALGGTEGEWEKARQDQAARAAAIVAAQTDAANGAGRGAPDLSVDPSSAEAEKDDDRDGDLGGETEENDRGDGAPIANLEDDD